MPVVNIGLAFKVVRECRNVVVVGLRWPVMYASIAYWHRTMLRVAIAVLYVSVMISWSVVVLVMWVSRLS